MGVFRQFPYSNFHEMNMDEIIKIIKNMLEEWAQYHAEWDEWMDQMENDWSNYQEVMNTAWANMQDFINNYFDNLDVQEEINNKIVSMVQSGEFGAIVNEYIPPHVSAWLSTHITQPTGVVIDTSLSVAGACADAKATGDAINSVKSALISLQNKVVKLFPTAIFDDTYYSGGNGEVSPYNGTKVQMFELENGATYTIKRIGATNISYGISNLLYEGTSIITNPTELIGETTSVFTNTQNYKYLYCAKIAYGGVDYNVELTTPYIPEVYEAIEQHTDEIEDIQQNITVPVSDIPNIPRTKVEGYSIASDGTLFENSIGCYYTNIPTEENTTYRIFIDNEAYLSNTRVHGYNGNTWVEQIAVFNQVHEGLVTIPSNSNIDNIRISTARYGVVNLKPYNYTIIDFINDRSTYEEDSTQYVNMGDPYTYLSAPIEDEILDSTTVDDVYAIYDALVTNYPQFIKRMPDIGNDESGLPMRLYRVGWQKPWMVGTGNEASWTESNNIYTSIYDYQKLFINAGTHGNEKSSVYGVALSIQEIVTSQEPWALYVRGNFIIDVCPVANPWGYNNTSRNGYGGENINRDFLLRTRSETQAIYNLLIDGGYHACIDSHNSGGNANYFGITDTNPLLKTYVQMNMKLAGIVYDSWDTLASGDVYAVKPYMQCWVSEPLGMLQDLFNELGLVGYLIESVGVYKDGIGILTPNHKKYCKFTKDLLINSIIALGSTNWD